MPITANSQRGVALLTILLLVVSITVVAGAMLASQKVAIRRSGLLFSQDQLLQAIDAGQQLAMMAIRADNNLNDTDSAQDIWAQPLPPYTLSGHSVTAEIRDEASRFNINNLYHDGKVDGVALAVLQRLLSQLQLEPEIAIAILDWQDADREVYNDGGDETVVYAQTSNRADSKLANQPFISIEQLQELSAVDANTLATLRPYITAVPYYLPINVNTASPTLLAALVEDMDVEQLQPLTDWRSQQVLESIDNLWELPGLSSVSEEQRQLISPLLAVDSQAFMALITATDSTALGAAKQRFATVLIGKTAAANVNNDVDNTANNNDGNNDAQQLKEVKVVNQRLWAFRPNF